MESRTCQNCSKDFNVDTDDFSFYEKMNVPPPTWCPECRLMRRLSFLNWYTLYKRKCDLCTKDMISVHHENTPFKVYCSACWWADSWDGTEYAKPYDPNRPFFEQFLELKNRSIFMGLEVLQPSLINTPYCNAAAYQKDCFMVFHADYGERCAYITFFAHATDCMDCYRLKNCERCYECIGMNKCYGCIYSEELDSCTNVLFSRACSGCTDCFGCINLRNKNYCIFNEQYSNEEYREKIKSFSLDTQAGIKKALEDSQAFWIKHPQRSVLGNSLNINTTGDMVYESKNTKDAYMVSGAEDSRYIQFITLASAKDCYDYTVWGAGAEKLYECLTVGEGAYNNSFCVQCWPQAINNEYCLYLTQPKNCFGCVNLKRKEYCILNTQYTKEEYFELKEKIIADMKDRAYADHMGRVWKYGELFPFEASPFAYNETMAQDFYPLTKEEAEEKGFAWYETEESKHEVTLRTNNIPQTAGEISDSIVKEILECDSCSKPYRMNELEILLLKKLQLPLPVSCWKCRHRRRFDRVNGPNLYSRACFQCGKDIQTSYAPGRPEIVYCESCYQKEIL